LDNSLQLNFAAKFSFTNKAEAVTRVPAAVGTFLAIHSTSYSQGYSTGWAAPTLDATAPAVSSHFLKDTQSIGLASVARLEARVMANRPAAVAKPIKSNLEVLYIGVWQAVPVSTVTAVVNGQCLSVNESISHFSSATSLSTGMRFSTVEYMTAGSTAIGNLHCGRLLEVVRCMPQLGASDLHIRTLAGMQVGFSPLGQSMSTLGESAAQGMLRSVSSESSTISVGAIDTQMFGRSTRSRSAESIAQVQRLIESAAMIVPGRLKPKRLGLYVISGGLGSLGMLMAEWIIR
jgi:hypothetical protein